MRTHTNRMVLSELIEDETPTTVVARGRSGEQQQEQHLSSRRRVSQGRNNDNKQRRASSMMIQQRLFRINNANSKNTTIVSSSRKSSSSSKKWMIRRSSNYKRGEKNQLQQRSDGILDEYNKKDKNNVPSLSKTMQQHKEATTIEKSTSSLLPSFIDRFRKNNIKMITEKKGNKNDRRNKKASPSIEKEESSRSIPYNVVVVVRNNDNEEVDDNVSLMTSEFQWKEELDTSSSLTQQQPQRQHKSLSLMNSSLHLQSQQQKQGQSIINLEGNENNNDNDEFMRTSSSNFKSNQNNNNNINNTKIILILILWILLLSIIIILMHNGTTKDISIWNHTIVPQLRSVVMPIFYCCWTFLHPTTPLFTITMKTEEEKKIVPSKKKSIRMLFKDKVLKVSQTIQCRIKKITRKI